MLESNKLIFVYQWKTTIYGYIYIASHSLTTTSVRTQYKKIPNPGNVLDFLKSVFVCGNPVLLG